MGRLCWGLSLSLFCFGGSGSLAGGGRPSVQRGRAPRPPPDGGGGGRYGGGRSGPVPLLSAPVTCSHCNHTLTQGNVNQTNDPRDALNSGSCSELSPPNSGPNGGTRDTPSHNYNSEQIRGSPYPQSDGFSSGYPSSSRGNAFQVPPSDERLFMNNFCKLLVTALSFLPPSMAGSPLAEGLRSFYASVHQYEH